MVEIALTTDRSMMTNHWGKEFLGFGTTGPPLIMPESLWLFTFAPKMKSDREGRPWQAPYGLRKLEAKLIDEGYDASVIVPWKLKKHKDRIKVLLISHHDYFGFGPPSSTFASIFRTETVNARSFKKFITSEIVRYLKMRGVKIIAGGPAAWHWKYREKERKEWGIDCVVEGEGERIICDLIEKATKNEDLPWYIEVPPSEAPSLDEIPEIKFPSVNGIVEIMRGCPRGCSFCSVTLRPLRFYSYDKIEKEIMINTRAGIVEGIIHSEDVLLYGAKGVIPQERPLIELHKLFKKHYKVIAWAHASIAAIVKAERDSKIMTKISEIIIDDNQSWWGAEIGIETGSPELARKIMPAKMKPYSYQEWRDIVLEAASIMEKVNLIPAMTLIVGLPGETEDDVIKTLELVDELWDFKSIIMPMFFVPMGLLHDREWFRAYKVTSAHKELLCKCLTHGVRQAEKILPEYLKGRWYKPILHPLIRFFVERVKLKAESAGYWCDKGMLKFLTPSDKKHPHPSFSDGSCCE